MSGGDGSDLFYAGAGDIIDGNESGSETDRIDLTGLGRFKVIRDPLNPENGIVKILDIYGNITGTLSFSNIETIVSCFTPGTRILTRKGQVAIERLKAGDLVLTRDHGLQPIRWIGARRLDAAELADDPTLQPVLIRRGALGQGCPARDMLVSRQHRMLLTGARAELLFGSDEVLVRALHLVSLPGIDAVEVPAVTYLHLLFDRHQIVLADSAWSESFQPGDRSLGGLDAAERTELFKIFPDLDQPAAIARFGAARVTLRSFEARVLLAA